MCFVEYLAYVCGHTSTAINRPCPMTTHLHTNPCCPTPACRPFLVDTMCHSCSRILHARRVNIAECEHRWMHERGACGCDVVFPSFQQPRLIHRPGGDAGDSSLYPSAPQHMPTSFPSANYGRRDTQLSVVPEQEGRMPLFHESHVGGNVEVAVRLTSMYAAEWTKDHAKLHETGKCKCPVSFERYKPLNQDRHENQTRPSEMAPQNRPLHNQQGQAWRRAQPLQEGYNQTSAFSDDPVPVGQVARWTMEAPSGSLLDQILGPVGPGTRRHQAQPVDIQTAHYHHEGIPIIGNPITCEASNENAFPSIVEFPRPNSALAGFPIGAGPEGESHAGDFTQCPLFQEDSEGAKAGQRRQSSEF